MQVFWLTYLQLTTTLEKTDVMELNPYNKKRIKSYSINRLLNNKEEIISELQKLEKELENWRSLEATNKTTYPGRKKTEKEIAIQEILLKRAEIVEVIEKKFKFKFLITPVSRIVLYFKS